MFTELPFLVRMVCCVKFVTDGHVLCIENVMLRGTLLVRSQHRV